MLWGFDWLNETPLLPDKILMKNFLKVLCLVTLAFNVTYGAVYRTGVAEGSVTYTGGGSSSGGPTNGMTGTEVTNTVNGLVPPMINSVSNSLLTGDKSVNVTLENWARYLNRGSNAVLLALGDSTGLYSVDYLKNPIEHYLGSNGVMAGSFSPIELGGAYTNMSSALGTNATAAAATNWPGTYYLLGTNTVDGPGYVATTNYGSANNGAIWSDTFRAYIGKSPSAGTLMWQTQTNGSAWTTRAIINANGTYGIVATQVVISPLGWYRSRLIYSNAGPTMVFGIEQFDGTATGRGLRMLDLTMAGSVLGQLTNISTNVLGPALALMNPAVVSIENRDSAPEYANGLPLVKQLFTNWIPNADVVLVGVGPQAASDSTLVAQNDVARGFAQSNSWTYVDMRALPNYATYQTLTNFYGVGDGGGVHYPDAARRAQATWMMKRLPILDNAFITGLYVGGAPSLSPPEGGRYFEPRKATNNLTGNLGIDGFATVGTYLEANGSFLYGGASSGLVLANRSSPTDAGSRWTLYNSGGTLIHYYGGDIFEQNVSAGNYRFSPSASGSAASRLGDSGKAWAWLFASNVNVLGNQTNVGTIYANQARFDMGGLHSVVITNAGANNPQIDFQFNKSSRNSIQGNMGSGYDFQFIANGNNTMIVGPNTVTVRTNLQANGITIYKSNSITASAVAAAITNGDFGTIVISNGLHHFWMSNNVMGWKLAAP